MLTRANYRTMPDLIATRTPFTHGSHSAQIGGNLYEVFSYSTLIATVNLETGAVDFNDRKYSVTTSRLQNIIRKVWAI